jgi:hypothetical protein
VVEPTARFEELKVPLGEPVHGIDAVSAFLGIPEWWPTGSRIGVVLAHGSQAQDPLLESLLRQLTEHKFLTLRFLFPFLEAGKRRPDPLPVLLRTFLAAVSVLGRDPSAAPAHLFLGGKNVGGLAALHAATGRLRASGLFFLGYPLHKQDDPSEVHAERLFRVVTPLLFVQGTKDRRCDLGALRGTLRRVGAPWHLHEVPEADHTLRVPKKAEREGEAVEAEVLRVLEGWMTRVVGE